jgi:hypothetical protein
VRAGRHHRAVVAVFGLGLHHLLDVLWSGGTGPHGLELRRDRGAVAFTIASLEPERPWRWPARRWR